MKHLWLIVALAMLHSPGAIAEDTPASVPVRSVELRGRVFVLNGKPFFPLFSWLQDPRNFPAVRECGMNATAGYHRGSGGTKSIREYADQIAEAGLYGVLQYDDSLKGHPILLGYIHDDEPDLDHKESDAKVEPGEGLRLNNSTPLWKVLDGVTHSWSVLDPMENASLTVRLNKPVTATHLAIHLTVSPGLSLPTQVAFQADGKEILRTAMEPKRGQQKFALDKPATFQALTLKVLAVKADKNVWGSIGEIEAFDAAGTNVLLSVPRTVPRATPEQTMEHYRRVKQADPSRPLFMTLTASFHPHFKKWPEDRRLEMYKGYVAAADVVGYDVYPIYGWNKPEWLHLQHESTKMLAELAGPDRPVYSWIETSKGGQWTGDLARQKDVTPEHIRCEVWMSICRGATAIGYFTHIWKPSYSQFGVPAPNRKALREINDQITRLAPAILGTPAKQKVSIESTDKVKMDVLARQAADGLYLFCVNYDERAKATRATIRVEGLRAGAKVEVVDEKRTIHAAPGEFVDDFAPLAVHVYRVR